MLCNQAIDRWSTILLYVWPDVTHAVTLRCSAGVQYCGTVEELQLDRMKQEYKYIVIQFCCGVRLQS